MSKILTAFLAALAISGFATVAPAFAGTADTRLPGECQSLARAQNIEVDCTVTNTVRRDAGHQDRSQKRSEAYPEAPTSLGGVWF